MLSTRRRRVSAFSGLALTLGTVVALSVATTGAYFTDSHPGSVNGNFGSVSVAMNGSGTGAGNIQFNFANMMPGEWKTATMTVTNTGTGVEDIYMVFTNANGVWSAINQLGTYGEANVNGTGYNNLNNRYAQGTPANPGQVNACGDPTPAIAYLPHVNYLGTLNPGQAANYTFAFRYTACISSSAYEGQPAFGNLSLQAHPLEFNIAAFQPGIAPNDPHNGAGQVSDLNLTTFAPYTFQ